MDSSYTVAGNALMALSEVDSAAALDLAKKFIKQPAKGTLMAAISSVLIRSGDESSFEVISDNFDKMQIGQEKFMFVKPYAELIAKIKNTDQVKKGIDLIVKFREAIPQAYHSQTDPFINSALSGIANRKEAAGLKDQAEYIKSKIK